MTDILPILKGLFNNQNKIISKESFKNQVKALCFAEDTTNSQIEVLESVLENIDKFDTNEDNKISLDEIINVAKGGANKDKLELDDLPSPILPPVPVKEDRGTKDDARYNRIVNGFLEKLKNSQSEEDKSLTIAEFFSAYREDGIFAVTNFVKNSRNELYDRAFLLSSLTQTEIVSKEFSNSLVTLLQDKDSSIRNIAASILTNIGTKESVPALINALKDPDDGVRASAAIALGRIGAKEAVPYLISKVIIESDSGVRVAAVFALGNMDPKEIPHVFTTVLKDPDSNVRIAAAYQLAFMESKESIPALIDALKDTNEYVRQYAISGLARMKCKEAIPSIIDLLKEETNIDVKVSAIGALGYMQSKESTPDLIKALKDPDLDVRKFAANALGRIGAKEAIPDLINVLKDTDSGVRTAAASALATLQSEQVIPFLLNKLGEESSSEYFPMLTRLGQVAVPQLLQALGNKDSELYKGNGGYIKRANVMLALGTIGRGLGKEKQIELVKVIGDFLLKDKNISVRESAATALGSLKLAKGEARDFLSSALRREPDMQAIRDSLDRLQ